MPTSNRTLGLPSAASERRAGKRRFITGMTIYVVAVATQSFLLQFDRTPLPLAIMLALLPMVPAVWAMGGWLRVVRSLDELQRQIHAEAGLFALATTALLTFSYGFLEVGLGVPRLSMFFVWPVIAAAYAAGLAVAHRRWAAPAA